MAAKKRTIKPSRPGQKPITFQPGGLHESLGVPQGQKIPKDKLRGALSGADGPKAQKQARMAVNVFGVSTGAPAAHDSPLHRRKRGSKVSR